VVAFCRLPATDDTMNNTTPKILMDQKIPLKKALALDTRNCNFHKCSPLDNIILAHHVREAYKSTFPLRPIAKMISVPTAK